MDLMEVIRTRRSVRKYQDKPIAKELLETIVDAGRLAATARNEQPWEFIVVTDPSLKRRWQLLQIMANSLPRQQL